MQRGEFGFCPRVLCEMYPMVPWGESVEFDECETRLYCHRCQNLYKPEYIKHQQLDGAYFGPYFAH